MKNRLHGLDHKTQTDVCDIAYRTVKGNPMHSGLQAKTLVFSFLLLLSACSLAPQYTRPDMPLPPALTETGFQSQTGESSDVQSIGWHDFFMDEQLRELIAIGLENNRDLKLAALTVAEARARHGVQRSERFPQAGADAGMAVTGGAGMRTQRAYEAALTVPAFELDFFGRLKNLTEASLERYLASREAEKTVRLTLVSQVAQTWLEERLASERLQLAKVTLKSWRSSLVFIESSVISGQSSLLELEQARSMVEFATSAVAQRERELVFASNALQLLLGSFEKRMLPTALPLEEQKLAELPEELSSAVLLGRPDVMEAEHNLRAANADIGAARAAFFPAISLTGSMGYISNDLSTLFSSGSTAWTFLPRITLPVFTAGRNRFNLEIATIRRESSVIQYEKTLQTAFREVADSLMSRASFIRQIEAQKKYLASQNLVLELAGQRYINGTISYLEVLVAQRNVFQVKQDMLTIRHEQLVNEINLYTALGGGLTGSLINAPEKGSAQHLARHEVTSQQLAQ